MAKNKQDYMAQGRADALSAKPRAAICAATWQAAAYDAGYNDGVREAQAAIVAVQKKAQKRGPVIHGSAPRYVRDMQKKSKALLARIEWKHKRIAMGHGV